MEIKKLLTNKIIWGIAVIVVATILILRLFDFKLNTDKNRMNMKACQEEALFRATPMKGTVTEKFEDQRKLKFFRYSDGKQVRISISGLGSDEFYNYIKVGDSLSKDINSLELKVWNAQKDTVYTIDTGCDNNL